jgi:hypothetical protein
MAKTKEKQEQKQQGEEMNHENLELAAYYHWMERGCPMGDELTDWVEVERKFVATAGHN